MANVIKSPLAYKPPSSENLIELIRDGLRKHADETIFIDAESNRRWTGKQLEQTILSIAKFLIDNFDIQKGDVCSVHGGPDDHFVIVLLAIHSVGAICDYSSVRYKPAQILDSVQVLKTKVLIGCNESLTADYSTLAAEYENKLHVISCDDLCGPWKNGKSIKYLLDNTQTSTTGTFSFDDLISRANIVPDVDIASVQYSSGTTGKPKPIPRTHKNLCHMVASVNHPELMDLKPGQVITGSLSVTHRPGLWALLASVNGGSTFVITNDTSNMESLLALIEKYKVTILSASLPILSKLGNTGIKLKDKFNTSSLTQIITSGAKIVHSALPRSIVEAFNLNSLRQCFGMTESGWVFLIETSNAKDNYLTVGRPVPSMEVAVLDRETLKPVSLEVRGELALKGPQIFPGYLTTEPGVYNRGDFTEDGWFKTGDEVFYDLNNYFYIEGRYKELLILENNARCFPNEVEAIINQHPAIETSCAMKFGEIKEDSVFDIVGAFATFKHGQHVSEKDLIDFVKDKNYELIMDGGIKIIDEMPRLANGKVDKKALAAMI